MSKSRKQEARNVSYRDIVTVDIYNGTTIAFSRWQDLSCLPAIDDFLLHG